MIGIYEKCATTFGVIGLERVHYAKIYRLPFVLLFTTFQRWTVYSTLHVRRSTVILCLYTLSFHFVCLFGVISPGLQIWSIPCMLLGLGLLLFWCLI
jgi:hypothetical protein